MPATQIAPSTTETTTTRTHSFYLPGEYGSGYGFDVDLHGNVTNPASQLKYETLKATGEWEGVRYDDHGIETFTHSYRAPALYRCGCGERFYGDGDHACRCGKAYNASGQEIDRHALTCSAFAAGYDCMCFE